MLCPHCEKPCEADYVDNGVGCERAGPFHCVACQWVEPTLELDAMLDFNRDR